MSQAGVPDVVECPFLNVVVQDHVARTATGLFEAAEALCKAGRVSPEGVAEVAAARRWIGEHLPRPELLLAADVLGVRSRVYIKRTAPQLNEHIGRVDMAVMEDNNYNGGPQVTVGCYARRLDAIEYEDEFLVLLRCQG